MPRKKFRLPQPAQFAEGQPAPPDKAPVGQASVTSQIGGFVDFYLWGNQRYRNLGDIVPVSQYPEYSQGRYSLDTRLYYLYEEMLEKDPHIFGVISSRQAAVTSRKMDVLPASSEPLDQAVSDFVRKHLFELDGPGGFGGLVRALLDAIPKGLAVCEIDWEKKAGALAEVGARLDEAEEPSAWRPLSPDAVVPARYRHLWPGHLRFDREHRLYPAMGAGGGGPLDERRLVLLRYNTDYDNPYGVGLLARLVWVYWFKKQAKTFWLRASEVVAFPSIIGTYKMSQFDKTAQAQMMEILASLKNNSVAAKPDTWTIDVLQKATQSGQFGEGMEKLCGYLDDEISKAVAGATLTSSEGRRSGSLALGSVHADVRSEKVDGDARGLEHALNQLIRRMVDYNFGPDVAAPTFKVTTEDEEDIKTIAERFKAALEIGMPLPVKHVQQRLGIPAPEEREQTLNITHGAGAFKDILDAGILTQNEVRARMGLPPVEGGDQPAKPVLSSPPENPASGNPPAPPAGGDGDASEDDEDEVSDALIEQIDGADGSADGVAMDEGALKRLIRIFSGKKKVQKSQRRVSAL